MKVNELMLGDLLYNSEYDTYGEVTGVIDNEEIYIDGVIANITDWNPIPITPEILEKNGFTRYGQEYANLQQWVGKFGDKRKSVFQDVRTGKWETNDVWIEHVHELQHVLKLCGIEKTIEL